MKKVIKLNGNQLRKLIKEAIQTREPGSPLFTPPKDIKESLEPGDELTTFLHTVQDRWNAHPAASQIDGDGLHWQDQVSNAIDRLQDAVTEAYEKIEQDLIQGEFYYLKKGGF